MGGFFRKGASNRSEVRTPGGDTEDKTKKPHFRVGLPIRIPGGDLLSQTVASQVPSWR